MKQKMKYQKGGKGGTGVKLDPGSDGVYGTDDDPGATNPRYWKAEKAAKSAGKTTFTFNNKTYKVKKKLAYIPKRDSKGNITVEKQMKKTGGFKDEWLEPPCCPEI